MIKLYLYAAIFTAGMTAGAVVNGWRLNGFITALQLDFAKATITAQEAIEKHATAQKSRLKAVERANAAENAVLEAETRTIIKTVIEYVANPETVACSLDAEWVRLHNTAAGN